MADESSNIIETSDNINDFLLSEEDEINGNSLNKIFLRFLANDLKISKSFKDIPGVWFCKWYNSTKGKGSGKGYNKGDFFWLNTENVEDFIRDNNQKIRDLANVNPFVTKKLPKWKNNDSEIYEQYYNVLTGYIGEGMSKSLSPLYEIGEISNNFQIVVSQKDNNTDLVNELSSWKNFAVNTDADYENILFTINRLTLSAMQVHIDEYHLGGVSYTQKDIDILSNYADDDFSNVKFMYPKNYVANDFHTNGLDIVDVYVRKPYSEDNVSGLYIEETWFRKWKSGYLEHGGIIDVRKYLNDKKDLVIIPFSWRFLDNGSKFYKMDFLGSSSGDPIEVDESTQIPPGDNLISVLYELDKLIIDSSEYSPTYYSDDYTVSLVPIQQQYSEQNTVGNIESYANIGYRSINENVLNVVLDEENCTKDHFAFKYNANTTPNYYSYYVTGFCK